MSQRTARWGVILAGGDGTRLRALTRERARRWLGGMRPYAAAHA